MEEGNKLRHISRRVFLKIAGSGAAGSVLVCGCASHPSNVTSSPNTPLGSNNTSISNYSPNTPTLGSSLLIPDRVAYICECKPDTHNPGGGGGGSLFIGNYCTKSERFLLHWNLFGLSPELRISRASVRLYCNEIYGNPSGRLIYALLNSEWGEDVTYNTQPENDANGQIIMDWPTKGQWQEIEITDIVKQWMIAPEKNYGLIGYAVDIKEETCSAVYSSIKGLEEEKPNLSII